jgi:hypothetical protein
MVQHRLRKDAKSNPAVEPFVGLRFGPLSGWLASSEMDTQPPEPVKMDDRAYRVRSIIVIVAAVLIAAPFVIYFLSGSSPLPTR